MLKPFRADLHIHTCLSPCADLTMSPKRIVEKAGEAGLDMIAICDHNSGENARAAIAAGKHAGLTVLPGMEITTLEEAHILAFFGELEPLLQLQERVYEELPAGEDPGWVFGEQIIADEFDNVEGYCKKFLPGALGLMVEQVVDEIHRLGGLAVAAHIDREAFSLVGQLGFIPRELALDALEVSIHTNTSEARAKYQGIEKFPLLRSSDAHFLEEIGRTATTFRLESPQFEELRLALAGRGGRRLESEE